MKNYFLLILALLLSLPVVSQNDNFKYGKVSIDDLNQSVCLIDSTAAAEYIFDIAKVYFSHNKPRSGFFVNTERRIRIKVYDKNRFDLSVFLIPYIKSVDDVVNIKSVTININGGKIVKTNLSRDNIFDEQVYEMFHQKKISFPTITDGCIIDFEYTINSGSVNSIETWLFQHSIPCRFNQYTITFPEFAFFRRDFKNINGVNLEVEDELISQRSIIASYADPSVTVKRTTYTTINVPALIEEEFLFCVEDIVPHVRYELEYLQFPLGDRYSFTESWETVASYFYKNSRLGDRIKPNLNINSMVNDICQGDTSDYQKMTSIFDFVRSNTLYNGYNTVYSDRSYNLILKDVSASSADINLLLISLLRAVDIDAYPMLLSTRSNSKTPINTPFITYFNYVVAYLTIKGQVYYLDATDDLLPMGFLPPRCFNGPARVFVNDQISHEVDLQPLMKNDVMSMYNYTFKDDHLVASVSKKLKGYAAYDIRTDIFNIGGVDEYIDDVYADDAEISDVIITDIDKLAEGVEIKYTIDDYSSFDKIDSNYYISPFGKELILQNPFLSSDRKFPVFLDMQSTDKNIIVFNFSDDYEIIQVPKSEIFQLKDNALKYTFSVSVIGNLVQIISQLDVNEILFMPEDYEQLREFYDLVIKKQNEKIVVKKNN